MTARTMYNAERNAGNEGRGQSGTRAERDVSFAACKRLYTRTRERARTQAVVAERAHTQAVVAAGAVGRRDARRRSC